MHWGYGMGGWMMLRGPAQTRGAAGAEDVLRERYARGEISREEFERMRDDLRR